MSLGKVVNASDSPLLGELNGPVVFCRALLKVSPSSKRDQSGKMDQSGTLSLLLDGEANGNTHFGFLSDVPR